MTETKEGMEQIKLHSAISDMTMSLVDISLPCYTNPSALNGMPYPIIAFV